MFCLFLLLLLLLLFLFAFCCYFFSCFFFFFTDVDVPMCVRLMCANMCKYTSIHRLAFELRPKNNVRCTHIHAHKHLSVTCCVRSDTYTMNELLRKGWRRTQLNKKQATTKKKEEKSSTITFVPVFDLCVLICLTRKFYIIFGVIIWFKQFEGMHNWQPLSRCVC